MATRQPLQPSPKLLALQKDFQQIASMAGFLNSSIEPPQMRLFFTLYGRVTADTEEAAASLVEPLQNWSEKISLDLREGSSSAILPPKIQVSAPQQLPAGGWYLVATLSFTSKVTDTSYLRVRTAVLLAYQRAVTLREGGFSAPLPELAELPAELETPLPDGSGEP